MTAPTILRIDCRVFTSAPYMTNMDKVLTLQDLYLMKSGYELLKQEGGDAANIGTTVSFGKTKRNHPVTGEFIADGYYFLDSEADKNYFFTEKQLRWFIHAAEKIAALEQELNVSY